MDDRRESANASVISAAVVIATHDRSSLLARCLGAVAGQSFVPSEIIVVDDGSTDDTHRVVRESAVPPGCVMRVARHRVARGPAAARNRGIRLASSDLIAFTDDDCEPERGWLSALATALDRAPRGVAGVGGRVVAASPGLVGEYMEHHRILEPPPSLAYLVTANCIYRRHVILAAGGFDERVRHPGGEDPGLAMRVRDAGWSLAYEPKAVVAHHFRESLRDFTRTFFRYGQGCRRVVDG